MVRSPPRRRQDEAPLTPPGDEGAREPHSAKRNPNSVSMISFGGCRMSEIPNCETDYYPRDATQRALFRDESCESCDCDCDCSSDGLYGCLRRNKQCLLTVVVLALTSLIIFLVFSFTYYEEFEHLVHESEQKLSREFHQHFFNRTVGEGNVPERPRKPVIEDAREPEFFVGEVVRYRETDAFAWGRKRRAVDGQDGMIRDAIERRKNRYEDVLEELQKMEDSLTGYKGYFSKELRTVFEPFSLTSTATPGWTGSEEELDDETFDAATKTTETESVAEEEGSSDVETTSEIGMTSSWHVLRQTSSSEAPAATTQSHTTAAATLAEVSAAAAAADTTESLRTAGVTTGYDGVDSGRTSVSGGTTPGGEFLSELATTPPAAIEEATEEDAAVTEGGLDADQQEGKSAYYFDLAKPMYEFELPHGAEFGTSEDGMVGVSLAEAKRQKEEDRKQLLLNSRVVTGSSEILFPTAPEEGRPVNAVESMKTSQQLSLTPTALAQYFLPYQLCFYASDRTGKGRQGSREAQPRTFNIKPPSFFNIPPPGDDSKGTSYHFPTQQNFVSFNINNFPAGQPQESQTAGPIYPYPPPPPNFPFNSGPQQQQPLFCTYIQPPLTQIPIVTGAADNGHPKCVGCEDHADDDDDDRDDDDYYYDDIASSREIGKEQPCLADMVPCRDGSACIRGRHWCDNKIHCGDASDEIYCSCRERLSLERLCDGYLDCPQGEDELGCFGCPKSTFSCDTADRPGMCIPLGKRCDGVPDCPAGEDEADCSALFLRIQGNGSHHVPYAKGYLHRNRKGDWYPVCVEVKGNAWAREACAREMGVLTSEPKVTLLQVPDHYKGPFIAGMGNGVAALQEHCKGHVASYVKCPEMQCGTRVTWPNYAETRFKRYSRSKRRNFGWWVNRIKKEIEAKYRVSDVYWKLAPVGEKTKREETGRVVGGRESEPLAWPWVVALYKNGVFHCGGIILDEKWVLTAAHCMDLYWLNHYEIRSGMLRRFSFSPMEQIRGVSHVIIHERYNKTVMNNDVALLRLQKPLRFNRWVRPACLPGPRQGKMRGPFPGTRCIAIGWGAVAEHGSNPDQMREVEVPILSKCRHYEDVAGAEICAGTAEGGKDTCQGDSGGPLLCRDSKSAWYAAGIVSHGEGCARPGEPGAYTRVSLYMDWITANAQDFRLPATQPVLSCPGFRCRSASRRCISPKWVCNGIVDCLNGEDELHCRDAEYPGSRDASATPEEETTSQAPVARSAVNAFQQTTQIVPVGRDAKVTAEVKPRNYSDAETEPEWFECLYIIQTIKESRRCDGVVDCEDGTDELLCSCADLLRRTNAKDLICDGVLDCEDASDETACFECSDAEFNCRMSKQCVSKGMRCDGAVDCVRGDDEENCYALRPEGEVVLGEDGRPLLLSEGRLMKNTGGVWSAACLNTTPSAAAKLACSSIGYSGYETYKNDSDSSPDCVTLHVTCSRRLTSDLEFYRSERGTFRWPWHAVVYSDGREQCSGALVDRQWLLAPKSCLGELSPERNRIEVKMGAKKADPRRKLEYGTQFVAVDAVSDFGSDQAVLLHLAPAVNVTWHARPLLLPFWFESDSLENLCVVTNGHEEVFLKAGAATRGSPRSYYPAADRAHSCHVSGARSDPWGGIVVCQSNVGLYPAAAFTDLSSFCDFQTYLSDNLLELTKRMKSAMDSPVESRSEAKCAGFGCRGGKCISVVEMCDGRVDCPWREDESLELCLDTNGWWEKGCHLDEVRCRNGKCVPKGQFGDGIDDCDDGSDEPRQRTCLEYLKVTSPERICDGAANCLDKSDEAVGLCPCSGSKFRTFNCTRSENVCVPNEYVCDGEVDCPDGEDEETCVGYRLSRSEGVGADVELVHMSYGVWHSLCSPRVTDDQAASICLELGFERGARSMRYRNRTRITAELDPFSRIKLNPRTTLHLRGSRTFATPRRDGFCDSLIIECE